MRSGQRLTDSGSELVKQAKPSKSTERKVVHWYGYALTIDMIEQLMKVHNK